MIFDNLSQRVSELSERLEGLQAQCVSDPANAAKVLSDALEELQISLKELSATDAELQAREKNYRTIVETANEGIIMVDAESRTTYANDNLARMLGYCPEEMIGRNSIDFYDKEHIALTLSKREQQRQYGVKDSFEFKLIRKDGSPLWVMVNTSPLSDKDGKFVGTLGMLTDITERKHAEEALRKSEEMYRVLAEYSDDFIYIIGRDDLVKYVNNTAARSLGLLPEDIIGKPRSNFFSPDVSDSMKRWLDKAFETANIIATENRVSFGDGRQYQDTHLIPLKTDRGGVYAVLGISRDITERKRSEDKIAQQNVILNAINSVNEEAIRCETMDDLGRTCLDIVESVTGSKFSFIGEIGPDGLIYDLAMSNTGWELCTMYDKTGHCRPLCSFKIQGLYSRVLQNGQSLLTNDPSSHPDSIGVPEGHPRLTAFLGVPFIRDGKAIGMIGGTCSIACSDHQIKMYRSEIKNTKKTK